MVISCGELFSILDDEFKDTLQGDEDVAGGDDGPGWDVDDEDLDLPDLVSNLNCRYRSRYWLSCLFYFWFFVLQEGPPVEAEGEGYFVPPNKGTSQAQVGCRLRLTKASRVPFFVHFLAYVFNNLVLVDPQPYSLNIFCMKLYASRIMRLMDPRQDGME